MKSLFRPRKIPIIPHENPYDIHHPVGTGPFHGDPAISEPNPVPISGHADRSLGVGVNHGTAGGYSKSHHEA